MTTWEKIKNWFTGGEKRHYQAARVTKANRGWTDTPMGANYLLRCDLASLRARARDMAKNSPHFRKFLLMVKSNVIGHKGIQLQCDAMIGERPHTNLNGRIEEAFWKWGHRETCTVSSRKNWVQVQRDAAETFIRDGEVLIEHIEADNEFGYSLKIHDVDWLDETHNILLNNGNRIIMGVEVDINDKPVAYWLTEPPSATVFGTQVSGNRYRRRVPAENMVYISEGEAVRGVTWFHAALLQGKELHEYQTGVVQSAKVAAHTFGFLKQTAAEEISFEGDCQTCNQTPCSCPMAPMVIDKKPLGVTIIDPGFDFQQFKPEQPTQNHPEFMNSMLHTLAAGLGVTGFSLAGNMSEVNFSSARVGLGEEREVWKSLQTLFAETLCREVFQRWLKLAWLKGAVNFEARYYDQLLESTWRPRGWSYIEPTKDITAAIDAIQNNLLTYADHFAERGEDLEDWLKRKQKEKQMFDEYGVEYMPNAKVARNAATQDNQDAQDANAGQQTPAKRFKLLGG